MKIRKSYVWAGVISLVVTGWLASGELMSGTDPTGEIVAEKAPGPFRVEVETMTAGLRQPELLIRGRTEALRTVDVRARTPGIVEQVSVQEGDRVNPADLLCRLDIASRSAQLAEARAKLASTKLDLDAADSLAKQKFVSRTKQAAEQAKFDAARAAVELMEREIDYTRITAPISGVVDTRPAEAGSFLQVGSVCARVMVLDPLLVVGQVSEREVAALKPGMAGSAHTVTGKTVEGKIRHVGSAADAATRTFRVELEVPNPEHSMRDGITSEIRIPLAAARAHRFSPALLSLGDDGRVGVRVVTDNNVVRFIPVTILEDEKQGVWVSGLPDTITLITTGQDYVVDGQTVEPVFKGKTTAMDTEQ